MGKKWYSYFVVPEDPGSGATPDASAAPRAVSDVAPETSQETAFQTPVDGAVELSGVYDAARIAAPPHGYSVLKVAEMLKSEHLKALPVDVKRKSIMVALDAAGVTVEEIIQDAVRRDRALDAYERVLQKHLDDLRSQTALENKRIDEEIAQRVAELRARVDENAKKLAADEHEFTAWQSRKHQEEEVIADAVGHFVSENPITTTRVATTKGETDAR
ncbi:MAG: hypothetical protein ABI634_15250 [Acidobacteriota bacterium]